MRFIAVAASSTNRAELPAIHDIGHGHGPVPDEAGNALYRYLSPLAITRSYAAVREASDPWQAARPFPRQRKSSQPWAYAGGVTTLAGPVVDAEPVERCRTDEGDRLLVCLEERADVRERLEPARSEVLRDVALSIDHFAAPRYRRIAKDGVHERPYPPGEGLPDMTQHPLEPLSADEFRETASILRRKGSSGIRSGSRPSNSRSRRKARSRHGARGMRCGGHRSRSCSTVGR